MKYWIYNFLTHIGNNLSTELVEPESLLTNLIRCENPKDFIDFMNNLFDCLNSRNLFSNNPYNCALNNSGAVKSFLSNAAYYFNDLFKVNNKGKLTRPPCFSGFTQTINGILSFFDDELKNDIQFLFTNRLNQDALENLFSIFRQKGGDNKNGEDNQNFI